jgi:hypothetical protein
VIETIRGLRREFPCLKIIVISGGGLKGRLDFRKVAERLAANWSLSTPFS